MNLDPTKLQQLVSLFEQSLNHQTTVQAGNELQVVSQTPDFLIYLLAILQEEQVGIFIRVATALYFKNFVIQHWKYFQEEADIIPGEVRNEVKNQIVDLMVKSNSKVQIHLCEVISNIAEFDFPDRWDQLIPSLTNHLSQDNFQTNLGVLQTINSIFKRWRSKFRSDELFIEINFAMECFGTSYLTIFQATDQLIDQNASNPQTLNSLLETLIILLQIYFSLISHDIPQFLVDNQSVFQGFLYKYLTYENPTFSNSNFGGDDEAGHLENVKVEILEIIHLYLQKYTEDFPEISTIIRSIWSLVTQLDTRPKFDLLTSKALTLLSSAVKMTRFQSLFSNEEVLVTLSKQVIIPNATLREVDEELLTDEPMEFIKRDLEGTDSETRRRSAADLVRSLLITFQKDWTSLFSQFIQSNLELYKSDPINNWKNKDTAIFLLSSIASTKQATSLGVTSSNEFIDVAEVFSTHILPDLQPEANAHPILKVDSIKYLFTFRNQLTPEQLFSMLPLLIFHLNSNDQVVYTYAAVAIERILSMKVDHKSVYTPESLKPLLENLLSNLFNLTFKGNSAQQIAENDYIMKTIMRTVIVSGPAILPYSTLLAQKLSELLKLIASNPSNPKYNHYAFETIGACIRLAKTDSNSFLQLETAFQETFQLILTQNIEEFVPYVIQILAQILVSHPAPGIPQFYQGLLGTIVQPSLWQKEGSIPALTRLLRSYLIRSAKFDTQITQPSVLNPILGIFQKLISSKINDIYGFELVREIFVQVPIQVLQPYLSKIIDLMLKRLQHSKTNKFIYEFNLFISVLLSSPKPDWNAELAVRLFETFGAGLFAQLVGVFVVNTIPQISGWANRKLVILGMTSLLTQTYFATVDPLKTHWAPIMAGVLNLLESPDVVQHNTEAELQQEEELIRFEVEDTTFSTAFVNLATSSLPPCNPALAIPDTKAHVLNQLREFIQRNPNFIREAASALPEAQANTLVNQFANLGIQV